MIRTLVVTAALALSVSLSTTALAQDYKVAVANLIDTEIRDWAQSDEVIDAIKSQNKISATLSQADIDRQDKQWRDEVKGGDRTMINAVLTNDLSNYLQGVKTSSHGKYTEIFVMDMKGLNVGQSDATSDYWQGDEDKWQLTYGVGPKGVLIKDVDFDESTQTYQSQVSVAIVDPQSGKAIGAVTVGVNVEMLE
ncbi:hypothetical protein J0X12_08065 [Sneathiella sp. CAU 1612]|uniref:DUF4440 domain-containing protein n=1 Tax=Sneathiella sedimenti TaxID=2816034 RepID=A0ABS3F5D5_9PROT|nr:hypothetical protein [Sneathiella sedimenti]MBO0333563.1 hypothetical protein [Sneathiella sedimenti]